MSWQVDPECSPQSGSTSSRSTCAQVMGDGKSEKGAKVVLRHFTIAEVCSCLRMSTTAQNNLWVFLWPCLWHVLEGDLSNQGSAHSQGKQNFAILLPRKQNLWKLSVASWQGRGLLRYAYREAEIYTPPHSATRMQMQWHLASHSIRTKCRQADSLDVR